jgi:hypothetical protein
MYLSIKFSLRVSNPQTRGFETLSYHCELQTYFTLCEEYVSYSEGNIS